MAELLSCPACHRQLQVPDELLGQTVHCPDCKHPFVARGASSGVTASPSAGSPPVPTGAGEPSRRRWDEDDDVEDMTDRLRRDRLPANRGPLVLTLGIVSLVLFGTCVIPLVVGPIGWLIGRRDLAGIHDGRLSPEGEGLLQAGRILSLVGFGLGLLVTAFWCVYFLFIALVIAAAGANAPQKRRG
jgi:MFS family permease